MADAPAAGARLVLLTPRGPGGVAVLAIEGGGRAALAGHLLRSPAGAPLDLAAARTGPARALLWLDGAAIDEALVVERAGRLEILLQGAEAVRACLEAACGALGEPAPGPADSLAQRAASEAQLALALEQRGHDFGAFLAELAGLPLTRRRSRVEAALVRSRQALALSTPARLVLCGAQNAGKSSLMNRLLFRERVLTGAQAGLTRDPVAEETTLDGYPYLLVDTAGEGAVEDELDRQALELGRQQRRGALRLVVVDGSRGPGELEARLGGEATLWVQNKIDLPQAPWPTALRPRVRVSCLDPAASPAIRRRLGERLTELRGLPPAGPVGGPAALSAQQYALLEGLL